MATLVPLLPQNNALQVSDPSSTLAQYWSYHKLALDFNAGLKLISLLKHHTLTRFGDYKRKFYCNKARQLFQIERELQRIDEEVIKTMFNDVKILRDNRYSQANELHRR